MNNRQLAGSDIENRCKELWQRQGAPTSAQTDYVYGLNKQGHTMECRETNDTVDRVLAQIRNVALTYKDRLRPRQSSIIDHNEVCPNSPCPSTRLLSTRSEAEPDYERHNDQARKLEPFNAQRESDINNSCNQTWSPETTVTLLISRNIPSATPNMAFQPAGHDIPKPTVTCQETNQL